jgi:hypothetical protein
VWLYAVLAGKNLLQAPGLRSDSRCTKEMLHPLSQYLERYLAERGIESEVLTEKQEWQIRRAWRDRFLHDDEGGSREGLIDGAEWFGASSPSAGTLVGLAAENGFDEANARSFFLLSSNKHIAGLDCRAENPISCSIIKELVQHERTFLDLCLCSTDFAWTMIFTHEELWPTLFVRPTTLGVL